MPRYTPPLRDMQFVLHEVLNVVDELKAWTAAHAESSDWKAQLRELLVGVRRREERQAVG